MKIKVCGLTTLEQMQQLAELDVDYAGLIFYEKSRRYAHEKLQNQKAEIKNLPIKKVGVFVDADMGILKSLILTYGLAAVQLHGNEAPEYCAQLQEAVEVIKVFRISGTTKKIDDLVEPFQNCCSYYLFDTDTAGYGGSGKRFDWSMLETSRVGKPFFLSGGIGPEEEDKLTHFAHPYFYAIDINSRFEIAPGIKDMDKIKSFINSFKEPLWIK